MGQPEAKPGNENISKPSPAEGGVIRFHALDSLRGLAALAVVFWHFDLAFGLPKAITRFPFGILEDGHAAVILFFVLSGFVLTLPYRRDRNLNYSQFVLKRICRIYLPYLGAIAIAIICAYFLNGRVPAERPNSWWVNLTWSHPVSSQLVRQHLLFLGNYDWSQFNTAIWSLVYEMRISLIFPLMVWIVLRFRGIWAVVLAASLSVATRPLATLFAPIMSSDPVMDRVFPSQTFFTLHYAAFFVLGALLAKNMEGTRVWVAKINRPMLALLLAIILLVLRFRSLVERIRPPFMYGGQLADWVIAGATILLIVLALHSPPVKAFLHGSLVHHLGELSYSLYLIHGTVLFAFIRLLPEHIFWLKVLPIYLAATFALTELFYRCVEKPSIEISKRIKRKRLIVESASVPMAPGPQFE